MNKNELLVAGVLFEAGIHNGCLGCFNVYKDYDPSRRLSSWECRDGPGRKRIEKLIDGLKGLGLDPHAVEEAVQDGQGLDKSSFRLDPKQDNLIKGCLEAESFVRFVAKLLP